MDVDWMAAVFVLMSFCYGLDGSIVEDFAELRCSSDLVSLAISKVGWRCQQHAIIAICRSDEVAASLYRVLMMRLLDGRPRSNPDLVPPHRCSYSRIGVFVGCSGQTPAVFSRLLSPSRARSLSIVYLPSIVRNRGPTTAIRTCATSLSRRSKSAVESDAIRHMHVTDMEESAKIWKQEAHALRHRFGYPRFALPAPGHLEAPVPRTRTEICRYPVGLLSFVCCCLWE